MELVTYENNVQLSADKAKANSKTQRLVSDLNLNRRDNSKVFEVRT